MPRNNFGYLKKAVPDNLKITIIQHGRERYQNKSSPFAEKDGRFLSQQWFEKISTNGEIVARKWLLYFHIGKHVTVLYISYFQKGSSLETLARNKVSALGES